MAGKKVDKWLRIAQKWLLPPVCLLCSGPAADCGLCAGCLAELPYYAKACRRCAASIGSGDLCGRCLTTPPPYDEAMCLFEYAPPVDAMIQRLKFGGNLVCARALGLLMAEILADRAPGMPQAIVPVPLHRTRFAVRGYNQALELARPIAARLRVPLDITTCARVRATAEQSTLAAAQRRGNVSNAFAVTGPVAKHIAVVDDVMTTGYTLEALVRALKQSGAEHVAVWVCARATLSRS